MRDMQIDTDGQIPEKRRSCFPDDAVRLCSPVHLLYDTASCVCVTASTVISASS